MKDVGKQDLLSPTYVKPIPLTKKQALKRFLYNKETGAVLGRTASSWGKSALFSTVIHPCACNVRSGSGTSATTPLKKNKTPLSFSSRSAR